MAIAWSWAGSLLMLCTLAWALNLVSLPGNWIVVALAALYVGFGPDTGRVAMSWPTVAILFVLALLGEVIEFVAAAFGAKRAGASRRSTLYAIVGSLGGALAGMVLGSLIPIPILGPVVAAVMFGAAGATGGAMYGEWTDGKTWNESWPIGRAAFWGRLLGTVGKLAGGLVMLVVIAIAVSF